MKKYIFYNFFFLSIKDFDEIFSCQLIIKNIKNFGFKSLLIIPLFNCFKAQLQIIFNVFNERKSEIGAICNRITILFSIGNKHQKAVTEMNDQHWILEAFK